MILVILSFLAMAAALAASRLPVVAALGARMSAWEAPMLRRGTWVIALVSVAIIWFTWDGIAPVAKVHDETSYLLQADIFARLRWTVPSPPLPEFFEQPHVQTVPAVASKYPPGHALMLTPGAMIGWHALMPLLLAGLTAALVFRLAARLTDVWTGLLAWLVWLTAPMVLRFEPSYFSEVTTTPLVLASWWLLLNWQEDHRGKWLWWMALAIGYAAITRSFTALAFAIPIGVVVIRDTVRLRLWRDLTVGVAIGTAVLMLLPIQNLKTTGDIRLSPVVKYRLDYMPFDKLGFTPDTTPPRYALSPNLQTTYDYFLSARKEQTLASVPKIIWDRAVQVIIALFQESRLPLALLALAGLFVCGGAVRFGILSGLVLFLGHVPYPHWAPWTIYYLEAAPVAAAVTAIGAAYVARRIARDEVSARGALLIATVVLAAFSVRTVQKWKVDHRIRAAFDIAFAAQLKKLPSQHAIVFIKYSQRVAQHVSEVFNYADLHSVPVWVVHDRGPLNAELRKMFPDRASFDFEEDQLVRGLRRPQP